MKKAIITAATAIVVTAILAIGSIAGCAKKEEPAKQYTEAYLRTEETVITTTVDLTGGYSCEFATGAAYLYAKPDEDCEAIAISLDQEVYEDYLSAAQASADSKEIKDGVMYQADGQMIYICKVGDNGYFGIFAENADATKMESIVNRFAVETF